MQDTIQSVSQEAHIELIGASGLLNENYYVNNNPALELEDPVEDYYYLGSKNGANPSFLFNSKYYLNNNPDVASNNIHPLVHYIKSGEEEGRSPSEFVDLVHLKQQIKQEINGTYLAYFYENEIEQGLSAHPYFDPKYYLVNNPDVAEAGISPYHHFLASGAFEGRNPREDINLKSFIDINKINTNKENPFLKLVNKDNKYNENKGLVQYYKDGYLIGWFYNNESFPDTPNISVTINQKTKIYRCDKYIEGMALNNGYCGFKIPVNEWEIDNILITSECGKIKIDKCENFYVDTSSSHQKTIDELKSSIKNIVINNPIEYKSKIAIFSTFLPDPSYYSYHKETINYLRENDYFILLVVPINKISPHCNDHNVSIYKDADIIITRDNFGYDFGSYATGLSFIYEKIRTGYVENVLFINDSIINIKKDYTLIDSINNLDFWGITESFERCYHIQSYFFGFNLENNIVTETLLEFFFGRGNLYTDDKNLVIDRFELSMTKFFNRNGIKSTVLFPTTDLICKNLKSEYYSSDYNSYFNIIKTRPDFNVSHFLWKELIETGFPFIKKELIVYNPTNYPYLYKTIFDTIDIDIINKTLKEIF